MLRLAVPLLMLVAVAGPAVAQRVDCEASVKFVSGEVIATVEGAKTLITWLAEPTAGVGEESDHFSRPGLLMDFSVDGLGGLVVSAVSASMTRVEDNQIGPAPGLERLQMRVILEDDERLVWAARNSPRGEAELAGRLKARWLRGLDVEVLADGDVVARSEFAFPEKAVLERLAGEALAKCRG